MMTHQDRMSKIGPSKEITDKPVAAFGGGKYRTPQAAGQNGKSAVAQQEAFSEVREAFRRVKEVHGGARKATTADKMPKWQETLAAKISRNRKLGSKQTIQDEAHAAELYHQRRRIQNAASLTERKKNKLDPELYPVVRMRSAGPWPASVILDQVHSRRAGLPPRPASARASTSASATSNKPAADGSSSSRPQSARPSTARGIASSSSGSGMRRTNSAPKSTAAAKAAPSKAIGSAAAAASGGAGAGGNADLGKPTTDVTVLRRRLLELIVDKRLFKEVELRPFLAQVVRQNKQFDAALLKEAVRDVEREFYLL